jgi:ATP-dependent DNA helicase RecQ
MISPSTILKNYWGYDKFRPLQEEIILSILDGKDVLALLPTGGGKSICFQVPALMKEGLCLVISPLIALMKDQVQSLRRRNITAFAIYSGMSRNEVINILKLAAESNCKFLYVSPERLETSLFKEYLPALDINLIAVDEAHCISQWGYDFRPPYLRIANLREELQSVPVLALTASATSSVQQDICNKLHFAKPAIFRQSFARKNLSFSVFRVDSKINKIKDILEKVSGSAIVYCKSRRHTKEISSLLNMHGIQSDFYHAGLKQEERTQKQDNWMKGQIRVIVCTNAFGMGIDKPDVRVVVHADSPDCLENYYQEAGRAGRDEKRAYAVLLSNDQELEDLSLLPDIHFPALDDIREVYQSLMNYLQIPSGTVGVYYDFDITDFIKKFKLDINLVVYALRALEQEEVFAFNEQVFIPSTIYFTTNKESLQAFEEANRQLEPLVKILLRTYSGIFDQPVPVHEKTIARLLKRELVSVVDDLKILHNHRIIEYLPRKEGPQLYLIQPRIKTEDLYINQTNYKKRKEEYKKRIDEILRYIRKTDCRSRMIAAYFGEAKPEACGICDNCLQLKATSLDKDEFNHIHDLIMQLLENSQVPATELFQHFQGVHQQKLKQVIDFLQSERKLIVDKNGFVKAQ